MESGVKTIIVDFNEQLVDKQKFNKKIIRHLLNPLGINFEEFCDLENVEVNRDELLHNIDLSIIYSKQINDLKHIYKSSKLTSLHENSKQKQRFPQVNLLRQILKCNDLKLHPKVTSLGYTKNGKKIIKRSYIIKKIEQLQEQVKDQKNTQQKKEEPSGEPSGEPFGKPSEETNENQVF